MTLNPAFLNLLGSSESTKMSMYKLKISYEGRCRFSSWVSSRFCEWWYCLTNRDPCDSNPIAPISLTAMLKGELLTSFGSIQGQNGIRDQYRSNQRRPFRVFFQMLYFLFSSY